MASRQSVPEKQSQTLCMDYRDIPAGKYDKITCLEMGEHVGIRKITSFFRRVYNWVEDDGVFYLQIAGLQKPWQVEDLVWGMFMNKNVFPGADASTPLTWYIHFLESDGWEVKRYLNCISPFYIGQSLIVSPSVDTVGIHYSGTIWRWYRNWLANADQIKAKYGNRWYRVSLITGLLCTA